MIFPPKTVARIYNGRKTMARLPVESKRLRIGYDYPASSPGHSAEFRVKITAVREERAGEISLGDAMLEGFKTTAEWKADWVMRRDRVWFGRALAACSEESWDDAVLVERFEKRHAHKLVRVVSFDVVRDIDLYMASQRDILSGREGQYTTNRARGIDELPVVSPATAAAWAKEAEEDGVRRRESFARDLEEERRAQKRARVPALRHAA